MSFIERCPLFREVPLYTYIHIISVCCVSCIVTYSGQSVLKVGVLIIPSNIAINNNIIPINRAYYYNAQ